MIEIKELTVEETRPLRHQILRPHQTLADCVYPGDEDPESYHYGAHSNGELITIASVFKQLEDRFNEFPQTVQFRLRGMGTIATERGKGHGKAVLEACLEHCWKQGGEIFWCNARTSAAGYYEKMGFDMLPQEFEIEGIGPHRVMYLTQ